MTSRLDIQSAAETLITGNTSAASRTQVVDALLACKNEATEPDIRRMSKVLTRLQAAAESALEQTGNERAKSPSFTESLEALSRG